MTLQTELLIIIHSEKIRAEKKGQIFLNKNLEFVLKSLALNP
jgi:hypothetical protein